MEKTNEALINFANTYEQEAFLNIFPADLLSSLKKLNSYDKMIEVVLDLGRPPEVRYQKGIIKLSERSVTQADLQAVIKKVGIFDRDNRGGIEKTLHRISAIYNRKNEIVGLTCRVGRALYGKIDIIKDIVEHGNSILVLGRPGVGKTTLLREIARYSADVAKKRVIIVDSNNEIGGDGDVPHPGVGSARRMQVPLNKEQHDIMIEAVENHNPEVIVVDEIGRIEEAVACRTIAERGVTLIGTAHGYQLENLITNPTLVDLLGGIQVVTLSDEEAQHRGTQKTVSERKAGPSFDTLIEIDEPDLLKIYKNLAEVVDKLLRGYEVFPEIRRRISDTEYRVERNATTKNKDPYGRESPAGENKAIKLYCNGIRQSYVERAIKNSSARMEITNALETSNYVLSVGGDLNKERYLKEKAEKNGAIYLEVKKNNLACVKAAIREIAE